MDLHTLVRGSTTLALGVARLPLSAAETASRHVDDPSWPPTLAFAGFEAQVHRFVGALANDEALVARGELEAARLDELRESLRLEGLAQERRTEAEERFRRRRERDEGLRNEVAEAADRTEEQVEEAQERAKADVAAEARKRKRAGREADERARERREARDRTSRRQAIQRERDAVAAAKEAADADAAIERTDERIRRSKSAR
jgi:hypothetical protein